MKTDESPDNLNKVDQLRKYAEDIASVYKSEKEKRQQLEKEIIAKEKVQKKLALTNDFLNNVMESTTNAICSIDLDGRISFANRRTVSITGCNMKKLKGRPFLMLFKNSTKELMQNHFKNVIINDMTVSQIEVNIIRENDKNEVLLSISLSPMYANKKVSGAVMVAEDVTERKSIEMQLMQSGKMASIGEMATGVAHELNQPLNVIKMAAQMLMDSVIENDFSDEFLQERADKILKQVDRASEIINHIGIFGRKDDGNFNRIAVNEPILAACNLLKEQLKLHSIDYELQLDKSMPAILGDANRLEQVFINLIVNSRDAFDEDRSIDYQKSIHVVSYYDKNGDFIRIEFKDNGPGIPKDIVQRIFDPFFTTKEVGKGTGLGLSISYGIIKSHNGLLEAKSGSNGTLFSILLPVKAKTQQLGVKGIRAQRA